MNIRKLLLPILILLSFSAIAFLPSSLNICLPDGCNFNNANTVCNNNACADETIISHLGERTQLLSATIGFQSSISFIVFAAILVLFFIVQKDLKDEKLVAVKSYFKQKLLNSSGVKLFNYLIDVFARGILHPKIY